MSKIVLLVEDDPTILILLCGVFESRGYTVLKAGSGSEAIMTAMNSTPDIVITDVNMPSGYGSSLYHKLRMDARTKHVPFIFITGLSIEHAKKLVPDSEGAVWVAKPFDTRKLVKLAEDLLSGNKPA